MPVNFHIGASDTSLTWFGTSPWPSQDDERKLAIGSAMMYLSNARILANLVFSGVLERFPDVKLRVGGERHRLDPVLPRVARLPALRERTRAWSTSCRCSRRSTSGARCTAASGSSAPRSAPVIDALGADRVLFETDYPHPTCLYPDPLGRVAEAVAGLDDTTVQMILQDNAAALYRIPLPATV